MISLTRSLNWKKQGIVVNHFNAFLNMLKRNLPSILVSIAMLITILGHDFSGSDVGSRDFWFFIGSVVVLIAAATLIIINETVVRRKQNK